MDDFGLRRLSAQQSQDLYELIIERHRRSSCAFTSNRGVDELLGLFDDPILGNSALDRANAAHQVVIEGSSYRAKLAPKRTEVVPALPSTLPSTTHDLGPAGDLTLHGELADRSW